MLKHSNAPTSHQLTRMLEMQDLMNARVDGQWVSARHPYLRAVVIEAAEAIEHHGWKWWKKQHKDLAQLQMELIDIWHFLLSEVLIRNKGDHQLSLDSLTASTDGSEPSIIIDGKNYEMYVDLGAYGIPKAVQEKKPFDIVTVSHASENNYQRPDVRNHFLKIT